MKAKFLKIAGVKNEKDFYAKYPTEEEFFAKCGAKIKKAYPGLKIPKNYQDGGNIFSNGTFEQPDVGAFSSAGAGAGAMGGVGGALSSLTGGNPIGMAMDIFKGFKQQKENVAKADQSQKTTRFQAEAMKSNKMYEQQNLQDERLKTYVGGDRDTQSGIPGMTGEELFPMYGVGTNVLAKDGININPKNKGKFTAAAKAMGHSVQEHAKHVLADPNVSALQKKRANFARNAAKWEHEDGGVIKAFGGAIASAAGGAGGGGLGNLLGSGDVWKGMGQQGLNTVAPMIGQKMGIGGDMGSQIGGKVGSTLGSLTGIPGMDKVGELVLGGVGDLLDKSDRKIAKSKALEEFDIQEMTGIKAGDYFQKQFGAVAKNGMTAYGLGGDVKVHGDGGLRPLSSNPYAGDMEMIHGPSHDNGGVDMTVFAEDGTSVNNGVAIEAEGDEVIMNSGEPQNGDEAVVILGNLGVPNHIKKPLEQFTGTKLSGGKYKNIGQSLAKQEDLVAKKSEKDVMKATDLTPLVAADRTGLQSLKVNQQIYDDKMKKFKIARDVLSTTQEALNEQNMEKQTAKKGLKIYAQDGTITSKEKQSYLDRGYQIDPKNPNRLFKKGTDPVTVEGTPGVEGGTETKVVQEAVAPIKDTYSGEGGYMSNEEWSKFYNSPAADEYKKKFVTGTPEVVEEVPVEGIQGFDDFELPGTPGDEIFIKDPSETPKKEGKGFDLSGLGQLWRDTDAEAFDANQLRPELWAMANNKLEAVQAQKYQPRLRTPYDISLQDQTNEVTAGARSAERMSAYSPEQMPGLKGQEYMAKSKILGDQFRQNQGFKDQVYSGNLQTLNDAQLKNLAIADTQYTRQEQAKSITKATDLEAIKSMTDKQLKHNLENKTLRVMENMYDYRYDPSGRAQYMGEGFNPKDMWQTGMAGAGQIPQGMEVTGYDKYGRPRFGYSAKGSDLEKAGKTPGFNPISKNGSIVKKFKKFK